MKTKIFLSTLLIAFSLLTEVVQAAEGETLEVVVSKPKAGVSLAELLSVDKKMADGFVSKQNGFMSREVGVSKDGSVIAIVHWKTLKDAENAGQKFMSNPLGKARGDKSEMTLFNHYILQ